MDLGGPGPGTVTVAAGVPVTAGSAVKARVECGLRPVLAECRTGPRLLAVGNGGAWGGVSATRPHCALTTHLGTVASPRVAGLAEEPTWHPFRGDVLGGLDSQRDFGANPNRLAAIRQRFSPDMKDV